MEGLIEPGEWLEEVGLGHKVVGREGLRRVAGRIVDELPCGEEVWEVVHIIRRADRPPL